MIILRYVLRELKWLSEVVIEELYLLWSETALCGDVPVAARRAESSVLVRIQ